jgi:signal transduction histidine kinase
VNALVRVRGVLRVLPKPVLLLPSEQFIQFVETSPDDPFGIRILSVSGLQTMEGELGLSRMFRIRGAVTCRRGDDLFVQDQSGGVGVEGKGGGELRVGDSIDVVGFPSRRGNGIVLTEASLRPAGQGGSITPVKLEPNNLLQSGNNGRLVSVEAVLLAQHPADPMQTLDLQFGQRAFQASLPGVQGLLPRLAPGSILQLVGVMRAEGLDTATPDSGSGSAPLVGSLELLLRSPNDVVVVVRPPWWNWKHTAASCGLVAGVFAGAVLWIRTLRRRVEERTSELRDTMGKLQRETQISATLAERDRLAAEIHDSVEQGLSAIMMQMEAATMVDDPHEVKRHLALARNMAGFSRSEVQHAVWDLQSPLLENADLITALRRVAQDISAGDTPRVTFEVSGDIFPLPSTVEHHLLRIAQEAITNAVKHGAPKIISLMLQYAGEAMTMTVRDDGRGFDPDVASSYGGHFGLQGMRTRADKIRANLALTTKAGEGTCIQITVSRNNRAPMEDPAQLEGQ